MNERRTLHVAHVMPTYLPAWRYGGPIRSVHGLCRALARRGHHVEVFTTTVDGPGDSDVPTDRPVDVDGVAVRYFPSTFLRRLYYSPPMARALRERVPALDVMHLHGMFLWPGQAAARVARRSDVPYVVAPKGALVPELIRARSRWLKTAWLALVDRSMLARADGVQVNSRAELDALAAMRLRTGPPFLIPHGIDPPAESRVAPSGDPDRARRIVFLGRISWVKGLDRLVPAMVRVPGAELHLAGNDDEGFTSTLQKLARDHGVASRVRFLGTVAGEAKWAALREASIVVLPSYSENFGMAVLEAMAAGRPVVVTPEVGMAEVVAECGAGLVVDGDPQRLGDALAQALDRPEELARMGRAGRTAIAERFTWDRVAETMERRYEAIIDARRR